MTVGTRSALQRYTPSSTLQCKRTLRSTAKSAAQPQEAAGEDAAFEEVVELVLHEQRQVGAGGSLDVGEVGLGMPLHHAVQRGLLGAAALIVNRGAIGCPLGLPGDGLHALLTFRPWGSRV